MNTSLSTQTGQSQSKSSVRLYIWLLDGPGMAKLQAE